MEPTLEQLQQALPELELLIEKHLGCKISLKVTQKELNDPIEITSGNIIDELGGTLVKTLFTSINVVFWGGILTKDNEAFWFAPKLSYNHPSGGSNGVDFIWTSLWFKEGKWIEGDLIIKTVS